MKHQKQRRRLSLPEPGAEAAPLPPPPPTEEAPSARAGLLSRSLPTVEGLIWLGLGVFFVLLRAFNLVTLIGSFMIGMLLLNWLRSLLRGDLSGLRIRRTLQRGVHAGGTAKAKLEIRNGSGRGQPGLAVNERGSCHFRRWSLPELRAGEAASLSYAVAMPRRGRYWFGPVEAATGYPFGLFRSWVRFDKPAESLILPQLGTLHRGRLRRILHSPANPTSVPERHLHRRSAVPADFYGVRDFRPGDSPRWIHWRTTARMGIPMVREFEDTPLDHLVVIVEAWLPRPARELYAQWASLRDQRRAEQQALQQAGERGANLLRGQEQAFLEEVIALRKPLDLLEQAISLAATLCVSWQQQSGTQLVLAAADHGGARPPSRSGGSRAVLRQMEQLAQLEGGPQPDLDGVVRQLAAMELPEGPILAVSPRPSPLAERLHAALRRPVTPLCVADPMVMDCFETQAQAVLL